MWLKCPSLRGTGRVVYDTVVQLKCDARLQSEKQGILGNGVVEIFTRRVSHLAEMTTPLPRGIPSGSHDRHLVGHKRKVCQLVTACRHTVVVCAVDRVRETPALATNVTVHATFFHPSDAAHVQEGIPSRAPLSHQPRALGLSVQDVRTHVMCWHRLTKICWQRLAGHCVALLMLRQCRQPNLGAEACESKARSDSKRLVPSPQVVLVRAQTFRQDLGLLRVVPCPFACHEPAEPLSSSLFWRSCEAFHGTESCPRQCGSTSVAQYCVFARTVAQKSWPTPDTMQ